MNFRLFLLFCRENLDSLKNLDGTEFFRFHDSGHLYTSSEKVLTEVLDYELHNLPNVTFRYTTSWPQ